MDRQNFSTEDVMELLSWLDDLTLAELAWIKGLFEKYIEGSRNGSVTEDRTH